MNEDMATEATKFQKNLHDKYDCDSILITKSTDGLVDVFAAAGLNVVEKMGLASLAMMDFYKHPEIQERRSVK